MNDWEGGTLGDAVSLQRGTTYRSVLLDKPGPYLLGLASIKRDGGFKRGALRTYGGDSPAHLMLEPGDVYVSLKDVTQSGDLLGAVAQVPPDVAAGRLTQDTVKLIPRSASIPMDLIYWTLRTPRYRAYCRSRAIGTTNLSLTRDDFLDFSIPPATAGRMQLVALLGALEDKIESNARITREARELAVRELWIASVGGPPTRLGNVAQVQKGLSYKGAGLVPSPDSIPMINLGNFGRDGWFDRSAMKPYSGAYQERHLVHGGELVVANTDLTQRRVILGRPALVPDDVSTALFTHHVYSIRPTDADLVVAIWAALNSAAFRERAEGYATGTTVAALPTDALLDFEFRVPDEAAIEYASALLRRAWAAEVESASLESVREVLIDGLLDSPRRKPEGAEAIA